jgi:formylglycine-generating enzyme required for sulfatase activity
MAKSILLIATLAVVLVLTGAACQQKTPTEPPPKEETTQPTCDKESAAIEKLITQLGDDDTKKRDAAQAELIAIGKSALTLLEKALEENDDPEVGSRARTIAEEIGKTIFTLIGKNPQGYEEYRHKKTGMVFVRIPGGVFLMGSDTGRQDQKPPHEVMVGEVLVAKYEVTRGVWLKVMGKDPSEDKAGDDHPVESVTWDGCQEFCRKTGLRLPTEAEWEYACRAGTNTKFYWGDAPDGDYMWYDGNADYKAHAVGQKKPNTFGLYDMSGNVGEWCSDFYHHQYYRTSPHDNPKGPESGFCRVVRGGSFLSGENESHSAYRQDAPPASGFRFRGFRCAADVPR